MHSRWALRFLLASAMLWASIVGDAQTPRVPYEANPSGSFRIAGVLLNAATGEPVRKGVVQALDRTGSAVASSTTDADGRFALEHLGAAKYQLTASKRGFHTASYDEHEEFATSIVTGFDQDTTHLQYKLMPNAVLHGAVTGDDGEPVAGASVMLFKRSKHEGGRIERAGGTQTDDTGEYEMDEDDLTAALRAYKKNPDGARYEMQIGFATSGTIGSTFVRAVR